VNNADAALPPVSPAASRVIDAYAKRIQTAASRVYDVAERTPLDFAPKLSARTGCRVWLKREDLQPVYSFKLRGAYNRIAIMSDEERAAGVITASAGNHAQGVALAGTRLGLEPWVVMPRTTPQIKVDSVRALGGKVILHGDAYDDAAAHALELAAQRGMTLVHPYDDAEVIAGQGTIAMEILEQHPGRLDALFVCTGGGGLLAGVAAWIKALRPSVRVISVEPDDSNCVAQALAAGRRVRLPHVGLFADGVAVRQVGAEPFRVIRHTVDEALTVSVDEICAAIRDVFVEKRALPEPAGALAVAGVNKWVVENGARDRELAAIITGANVNFDRLRHIAERAEFGDCSEALLAVTIPETPGSFLQFLRDIGSRTITEFNYRYASGTAAHVFAGVRLSRGRSESAEIVAGLRAKGYAVVDMTDNEMAKVHVRYMVGGRAPGLPDEHLFRFAFPERPGACVDFLQAVGSRWNISMFHYRNHGAAYGRVLCGLQVPRNARAACRKSLESLGYEFSEETGNPAYSMFLGTQG